jgi:hypothetical protein
MKIAGLDIGGASGVIIVNTDSGTIEEYVVQRAGDNRETALNIINTIDEYEHGINAIVSEQFRGLCKSVDTMNAAKVESMVQFWYYMGSMEYVRQYPAVRTGFIPVAKKLVQMKGEYRCHVVDALAHVLRYLYKEHREEYDKLAGGIEK